MAIGLYALIAATIYLAPIAMVFALRAKRDRAAWEMGLDVPFTVAVDLVAIMALTRLLPLEGSAIAVRIGWLVTGGYVYGERAKGGRFAWPRALGWPQITGIALATLGAYAMSYLFSRGYAIWDREHHIPMVSSLRGQKIPFENVYASGAGFHYHFSGDVLASILQTYSFNTLHASIALSLAHDLLFALIAATTSLFLLSFGIARPIPIIAAPLALLLVGPCVLHGHRGETYLGFSFYSHFEWGFRPHQMLAFLETLGIGGGLLVRWRRLETSDRYLIPQFLACGALLAVTDETSTGMLGLCLAASWLADPQAVATSRARGLAVLVALGALFIGTNLLFDGALARGGPVQKFAFVPWRVPGAALPPLPLSDPNGLILLGADWFPTIAFTAATFSVVLATHRTQRTQVCSAQPQRSYALIAFLATLIPLSFVALTRTDINGAPMESHRFVELMLYVVPLFALAHFASAGEGSFARAATLAGFGAGGFSTLLWISHCAWAQATPVAKFQQSGPPIDAVNCRNVAGSRLGDRPIPTYLNATTLYLSAGCLPVYTAGFAPYYWPMRQQPLFGKQALAVLDRELVPKGAPVRALCPAHIPSVDDICRAAIATGRCSPQGSELLACDLSQSDRDSILAN